MAKEIDKRKLEKIICILYAVLATAEIIVLFLPAVIISHKPQKGIFSLIMVLDSQYHGIGGMIDSALSPMVHFSIMIFFAGLIAWIVMTLLRKKIAGIIGIVSAAAYFLIGMYWIVWQLDPSVSMKPKAAFPMYIIIPILAALSLVLGIIQFRLARMKQETVKE